MYPFFVYGTLLPNQPNAYLWQSKISSVEPATLTGGLLYDMGNFPMLILGGDQAVVGAILIPKADQYAELMAGFDQLERYNPAKPDDSAYKRVQKMAQLADGSVVTVWVYVGDAEYIAGMSPIPNNDWLTHAISKSSEIQQWWANFESLFPQER